MADKRGKVPYYSHVSAALACFSLALNYANGGKVFFISVKDRDADNCFYPLD
jgi:hypothetical protein